MPDLTTFLPQLIIFLVNLLGPLLSAFGLSPDMLYDFFGVDVPEDE